jgi:hypothetical protein
VSSNATIARVVGVLFIVATITAIVGGSLLLPLAEEDYLAAAADAPSQIVSGVVLEFVLVLSVIAIAALLHPVLRRHDDGLAVGYVAARILEGVLLLAASVSALLVLSLAVEHGAGTAGVEAVGDAVLAAREWTLLLGSLVMLGVSAVILNALLLRSGLVPSWLSGWGLVGGGLILVRGLIELYGVELSGLLQGVFAAPIALQEMVLAVWLIVRGFDPSAVPASADVSTSQRGERRS